MKERLKESLGANGRKLSSWDILETRMNILVWSIEDQSLVQSKKPPEEAHRGTVEQRRADEE